MTRNDRAPIIAAVITAIGSLLVFSLSVLVHQDERLDHLERIMNVLVDEEGRVRPSREALESYFNVEDLEGRVDRIVERLENQTNVK